MRAIADILQAIGSHIGLETGSDPSLWERYPAVDRIAALARADRVVSSALFDSLDVRRATHLVARLAPERLATYALTLSAGDPSTGDPASVACPEHPAWRQLLAAHVDGVPARVMPDGDARIADLDPFTQAFRYSPIASLDGSAVTLRPWYLDSLSVTVLTAAPWIDHGKGGLQALGGGQYKLVDSTRDWDSNVWVGGSLVINGEIYTPSESDATSITFTPSPAPVTDTRSYLVIPEFVSIGNDLADLISVAAAAELLLDDSDGADRQRLEGELTIRIKTLRGE